MRGLWIIGILFFSSCMLFSPESPQEPTTLSVTTQDTLLQFSQIFESYYENSSSGTLEKLTYANYDELFKDTLLFFQDYNGVYAKTDQFESRLQTLEDLGTKVVWRVSTNSQDNPAALYKDGRPNIFRNLSFVATQKEQSFDGVVGAMTFEYYSGQWYITHWEERVNEKSIFHYEYAF